MNTANCERANDLVSFLYGEAEANELYEFEQHLKTCRECRKEVSSLGGVKESIGLWKTEALGVLLPSPVVVPSRKRSAIAALREFFELSPFWMKAAVTFTAVLFCAMVIFLLAETNRRSKATIVNNNGAKYSEQDLQDSVAKALKQQAEKLAATTKEVKQPVVVQSSPQKNQRAPQVNRSTQWAKSRRPLSRSERQQLAADLRLLSPHDDDSLDLIGDRINKEF